MTDVTPLGIVADPEQINKWLAQAILDSQLGKTLKDAAVKALGNYDFQREVSSTIQRLVADRARTMVENDPDIQTAITEALKKTITPDLIAKIAAEATAKLQRY